MLAPVIFVRGGNLQDGLLSCPRNLRGMRQQSKKLFMTLNIAYLC
jgi:hypothetical protein